jgi:hypothetical protein
MLRSKVWLLLAVSFPMIIVLLCLLVLGLTANRVDASSISLGNLARADRVYSIGATSEFTPTHWIYLPSTFKGFNPSGCSNAPLLVSPSNGSSVDSLWPLYQWNWRNNPDATETRFEIALDPAFSQLRYWSWSTGLHGTTDKPVYNRPFYNLIPDTIHYWRVFLKCGPNRTLYSDVWSFTPNSGGIILPSPVLLAPSDGARIPASTVTLQWSPLSGATQYMLRYRPSGGFETFHVTSNTSITVGPLRSATTYEWWVSGINDYAIGSPSAKWRFTTP